MRSDGLLKHLAICAALSVVFYAGAFAWIQHRRSFRGPWEAEFRADATGAPSVHISQTRLGISETLVFYGQTIRPGSFFNTIAFTESPSRLPFGELIFQDPTFLPGTVTLQVFGHEVEVSATRADHRQEGASLAGRNGR